jgi:methyl-accepting chemotaxis protein
MAKNKKTKTKIKNEKPKKIKVEKVKKKKRKSLNGRLVRNILLIALLLISTATILIFFMLNILVTEIVSGLTLDSVGRFDHAIQERIDNAELTVRLTSLNTNFTSALDTDDIGTVKQEANAIRLRADGGLIVVTDSSGKRLYESGDAQFYVNPDTNNYEVINALDQEISVAFSESKNNAYTLRVGGPVYHDSFMVGTISVGYVLSSTDLLVDSREKYSGHFTMYKGTEFVSSSLGEEYYDALSTILTDDLAKRIYDSEEPIVEIVTLNGENWAVTFESIPTNEGTEAIISNAQNLDVFGSQLKLVVGIMAAVMFVVAVIGATIVYFNIRRNITKPIRKMSRAAEKIGKGQVDLEIKPVKTGDEIELLNDTFIELLSSSKEKSKIMDSIASGDISNLDFKASNDDVLGKNMEHVIETLNKFSTQLEQTIHKVSGGTFNSSVDSTPFAGVYREIGEGVNHIVNYLVENINQFPNPVFVTNEEMEIKYVNEAFLKLTDLPTERLIDKKIKDIFVVEFDNQKENSFVNAMKSKDLSSADGSFELNNKKYIVNISSLPNLTEDGDIATITHSIVDQTSIKEAQLLLEKKQAYQAVEVERLTTNLNKLANGQFDLDFRMQDFNQDVADVYTVFKTINNNLETSVSNISNYISQISFVLNEIANSNLDLTVDGEYVGEFETIKGSLSNILDELNTLTHQIILSSETVNEESVEVNQASQELNHGATQQAAAIEEISATITQVSAQVRENSEKAGQVREMVSENETGALTADDQMNELLTSMKEISEASDDIAEVLKMINDISFQTNILSLNAAVEAARAGKYGKGFAVIAEDVRNLALKSAEAAKETDEMIGKIRVKIKAGSGIANNTAESLKEIVESSKESSKLSNEVALASEEQAIAIAQITNSIDQISSIVQNTSFNARKSHETAEGLSSEAKRLNDIISVFKLRDIDTDLLREAAIKNQNESVKKSVVLNETRVQYDGIEYEPTGVYKWEPKFSVNNQEMDMHHSKLFDLTDRVYFAIKNSQPVEVMTEVLNELIAYTRYHFNQEEEMMATLQGYEKINAHKQLHRKFVSKLEEVRDKVEQGNTLFLKKEVLEMLVDWLINHIQKVDKEYGEL